MRAFRVLIARVRGLFGTARRERELAEELETHVQMHVDENIRRGHTPGEARRLALVQAGGLEAAKDAYREQRGIPAFEQLAQDLRYGLRALRRSPTFTMVIVTMLALGIGANTAMFTLFDAIVVRGLPVTHPDQLVAIGDPASVNSTGEGGVHANLFSYPLYQDVRDHRGLFSGVAATGPTGRLDVIVDGSNTELEHPHGRFVSANYFSVLGVPPVRGRVFDGSEDLKPGGSPVAVISHEYWTRRFQQDPSIIGKGVVIDNNRMTIIGVTPRGFAGEVVGEAADVWLPVSMRDALQPNRRKLEKRTSTWLLLLGRLAPGVTLEQARQDLMSFIPRTIVANAPGAIAASFLSRKPVVLVGRGDKGFSEVRETFEAPLLTLMIGVALLLCIICANVANLLLARAIARGREMAVRLALGAARIRLVRQLVTESLIVVSLGAAAGLLVAWWGSRALLVLASDGAAMQLDVSLDGSVLAFTLLTSFVAVMLFGLMPALRASRVDYAATLRASARSVSGGSRGQRGRRVPLGNLLVAAQVALSVVLLVCAAMLTRSLRNVESVDVGMDRDHLLILDVDIAARGYSGHRLADLTHLMRDRLAAIQGVNALTYSENGIFTGTRWHTSIQVPGFVARAQEDSSIATDNAGPGYARGIGARLVAGRDIAGGDETRPDRVALVNEAFAKFYFPRESAIGKTFHLQDTLSVQVIGVIADTHDQELDAKPDRHAYFVYIPTDTLVSNPGALHFAIRTAGDPARLVEQVRRSVVAVDPLLPIDGLDPLTIRMRQSIREERLVANMASAFGALALLLASIGLYGVMTYAVAQRTGEIGLRAALGATRQSILRLVLVDSLRLLAAGMIIGVPLALAAARVLHTQLHGVAVVDRVSIAVALLVLATSACVAAWLPAIRATRVSPLVALQSE